MAWYQKDSQSQSQLFITKPYSINSLLLHKDILIKDLGTHQDVRSYINHHKKNIVEQCLVYCLKYPSQEDGYERKYVYPTKTIQLMTNQHFFNCLDWDKDLVSLYIQQLLRTFMSVSPHIENINIYHGYFERLFRTITRNTQISKKDVMSVLQQQRVQRQLVSNLLKYITKDSIALCLIDLVIIDYAFDVNVNLDLKVQILSKVFNQIEAHTSAAHMEEQAVENCLQIIRKYLEESIRFLLNTNLSDPKAQQFKNVYLLIVNRIDLLMSLFKSGQPCIQVKVLDVLQMNEILLFRIKGLSNDSWCYIYRKQIIAYFINSKLSIVFPSFIEFLIIVFADIGENCDKISLLKETNIVGTLLIMLFQNKVNSIINSRIFELLKILFMNLQKQILLNIERNKSIDMLLISFPFFDYMAHLIQTIQAAISKLKHYNELLFTHFVKSYKQLYQNACNIDSIFNHYSFIPLCTEKKTILTKIIDFYREEGCFRVYETQISKELGQIFNIQALQNLKPTQYQVITKVSQPSQFNPLSLSVAILPQESYKPPISSSSFKETSIQLSKADQQEGPLQKPEKTLEKTEINDSQSYDSYLKKQMIEAQRVRNQRKSKSRTPTKIKNEVKKSKNKWTQNQEENNENSSPKYQKKVSFSKTDSCQKETKNKNLKKISLIKLSCFPKQKTGERQVDSARDQILIRWLKEIRK